ncbi:MAG: hypothetical protein MI723_03175, partial [Caulobacterales bacterium]|nr:hypothetical protein [Caulobacterales bacterium]
MTAGGGTANVWLGLAYAHAGLREETAKLQALDRALQIDPHNARALILKGDHYAKAGDVRAASTFYMAALRAAPPAESTPADLASELARARSACARYASDYEGHLRARLAAQGPVSETMTGRFERALDIMLGRKQVYLQEPSTFYFPELPQIQFYE